MPAPSLVIAIDGPSGSGKSSVSREVARRLGLGYLDTGAMYRAASWWCLDAGIDLADQAAVAGHVARHRPRHGHRPRGPVGHGRRARRQRRDPRDPDHTAVSVGRDQPRRPAELRDRQRAIIAAARRGPRGGCVAEGRDITTVVAPDADVRVLLTASEDARLARRAREVHGSADGDASRPRATRSLRRDRTTPRCPTSTSPRTASSSSTPRSLDFEPTVEAVLAAVGARRRARPVMTEPDRRRAPEERIVSARCAPAWTTSTSARRTARSSRREGAAGDDAADDGPLPVLAVVGRPNVGKSTLVNRILGRREAVVEDMPGVTRDRVTYEAEWAGRRFTLVDTGGWELDVRGLSARVAEQAEFAVELADAVVFVVDAKVGATDTDEAVVRLLRRSGKPVVLAANKVDDQRGEADAAALWSLGLGEPHPVSALHGRGSGDLLDAVLEVLPPVSGVAGPARGRAAAGRPDRPAERRQVLAAQRWSARRSASSSTRSPGTTRDPVDELIELGGGPGGSSTRPASAGACTRPRAPTSTPRCAPRPRWRRPRSRSS